MEAKEMTAKYVEMQLEERTIRRRKILVKTYENPLARNMEILNYVRDGLTLEETLGTSLEFVKGLPFTMDPMHKSFVPGEAFFNEPIDLSQSNHKMYDSNGCRTLLEGMIGWKDTYENACVIALAALFQKMLLDSDKKYTAEDIKQFMLEKGILLPEKEDDKYLADRNSLLRTTAERMVKKLSMVKNSRDGARIYALNSVYDDIARVGKSEYLDLEGDIKMYHWSCRDTRRSIDPDYFKTKDEINAEEEMHQKERGAILDILFELNKIYCNGRNVSLNSKRNYMIKVATELTQDVNYAIYLVEKYFNFGIRKVDMPKEVKTLERINFR